MKLLPKRLLKLVYTKPSPLLRLRYSPLFVRPESLIFYSPLIRDRQELIGATTLSDSTNSPDISAHPRIIYPSNYNIAPFTVAAAANLRRYTLTTLGVG